MKTHKLVFLTTLLAISTFVSAQEYAFKVLANKGNNEVKSGPEWQPLKTGATLNSGDEVKLSDNAYIGLVHSSGKPVEVKSAGVHKVSDLENKVPSGSSVLNKYTDFILSSNASGGNRLSATGAVSREVKDGVAIKLALPEKDANTGIFNSTAIINWDGSNVEGPYIVTLKNMFEDVLSKDETSDSKYVIDFNNSKYARENAILIEVSSKANPKLVSQRHLVKQMPPAEREKIASALKEIESQISEETALNKVFLAGFYENNNLLIDAIYAFEQALKLEPGAYEASYEDFLLRHNLK